MLMRLVSSTNKLIINVVKVYIAGDDGVTALMNACLVGNVRIVELLLGASGIDVNARDNSGLTALDHANPEREDFGELRSRMEDIRKLITTASTHTQIKNGAQIVLESAKKMAKRLSGRLSLSRAEKKKDSEKTIESKKPNESEEKPKKKVQKNKMRCFECRKKIGLAGIDCNCGFVFCGEHSYPANHNCDYDFKAEARARYMHNHAGKGAVVEKIVGEKL